jgi:hypothetical protein
LASFAQSIASFCKKYLNIAFLEKRNFVADDWKKIAEKLRS